VDIRKTQKLMFQKKKISKKLERILTLINYIKTRIHINKIQSPNDCFLLYFEQKILKIIYSILIFKQFWLRKKYYKLHNKIQNIFLNQKIQH